MISSYAELVYASICFLLCSSFCFIGYKLKDVLLILFGILMMLIISGIMIIIIQHLP
jgi:hypothetical protein